MSVCLFVCLLFFRRKVVEESGGKGIKQKFNTMIVGFAVVAVVVVVAIFRERRRWDK